MLTSRKDVDLWTLPLLERAGLDRLQKVRTAVLLPAKATTAGSLS